MMKTGSVRLLGLAGIAGCLTVGILVEGVRASTGLASQLLTPAPTATAMLDPLAIPSLPENPSQEELGRHVYYYNCMPCHGDQGQGLTDAWRQVWEEDHRDCWGRGCHGGRERDEGFPIPTIVPAIILEGRALSRFSTLQDLLVYLKATHPPQEPGRLADQDYQEVAAYLWSLNGKSTQITTPTPAATLQVGIEDKDAQRPPFCSSVGMLFLGLLGAAAGYWYHQRK